MDDFKDLWTVSLYYVLKDNNNLNILAYVSIIIFTRSSFIICFSQCSFSSVNIYEVLRIKNNHDVHLQRIASISYLT